MLLRRDFQNCLGATSASLYLFWHFGMDTFPKMLNIATYFQQLKIFLSPETVGYFFSLLAWNFVHECKDIFLFLVVEVCINFWRVWQIRALGSVIEGAGTIQPALFMRTRYVKLRYGATITTTQSQCQNAGVNPHSEKQEAEVMPSCW